MLVNPAEQLLMRQAVISAISLHLSYKGTQLNRSTLAALRTRLIELQQQSPLLVPATKDLLATVDAWIARK